MNYQKLIYLPGLLLLSLLYLAYMDGDGYRLPRYYTPDGSILSIGAPKSERAPLRFESIAGREPASAPAIFDAPGDVIVATDTGIHLMRKISNDAYTLLKDFKYLIILSYIFITLSVWFLRYGNDYHLSMLSFLLSGLFYTTFVSLAYHQLQFFWQLFALGSIPALINMALRTTGKEISGYLLLGELILVLFVALVAYVGKDNTETYLNIVGFIKIVFYGSAGIGALILLDNSLKKNDDRIENLKRWSLSLGFLFGVILPVILIENSRKIGWWSDPLLLPFLFTLIFPASLVYGTYRIHLTPFQFTLSRSILAALLTIFLIIIYGVVLLMHGILAPDQQEQNRWIVHLIFILILVFFLDPARRIIARFLEKRVFRLNPVLTESLERLARILSSPTRIQTAVGIYIQEIQNTLGVKDIHILFSENAFPELKLKQGKLLRIPESSRLWKHLGPEKITATSYLTYGSGSRGDLYRLMTAHRTYLAFGITGGGEVNNLQKYFSKLYNKVLLNKQETYQKEPTLKTAIFLGYRKNKEKFRLQEIRYIQEASRLAKMIIENYFLLIQNLEYRKRIRELLLAGEIQKSMNEAEQSISDIRLGYYNRPAISVSGDYADIIPLPPHRVGIFLGDISGHGLGTGYLVSALRSILRTEITSGQSLTMAMETANRFLLERYGGNEFATVFASILDTKTGELIYINAGHPFPILKRPDSTNLRTLDSTTGLLGFQMTSSKKESIFLKQDERLFLYSDGITETLNEKEETYSFTRLKELIASKGDLPIDELTTALMQELDHFRGNAPINDDASFLVVEYSPGAQTDRFVIS